MEKKTCTSELATILDRNEFSKQDLINLLNIQNKEDIGLLRKKAEKMLIERRGKEVYFRGLLEFSNICTCDCFYCGIRKSNTRYERFILSKEEIVETAKWCAENGYGSIVLQSGERRDKEFIDFLESVVKEIKEKTKTNLLPNSLGITLSVGEQDYNTYKRWFDAGAHRYLLRIETTSPKLFGEIHPKNQLLSTRKNCLQMLKDIGYKVGTGVMIGIPGQTAENLAEDILFFKENKIDMIGMGPYIRHADTPMASYGQTKKQQQENLALTLKMIAIVRLLLKDANIASTTALQAISPIGRELGLEYGANVIMPLVTPPRYRRDYLLYDGKPCVDEDGEKCKDCLSNRIRSIGRTIGYNKFGDYAG